MAAGPARTTTPNSNGPGPWLKTCRRCCYARSWTASASAPKRSSYRCRSWALRPRPYGVILISNVGTFGLDSVSAPVPTFCHAPITVVAGAMKNKVLARDGHTVVRPVLPLTIGLDHRFVDGYQAATTARVFREYMENPAE